MALVFTTIGATEASLLNTNSPVIVPSNRLLTYANVSASIPFWNLSGTDAGTDITDPLATGERVRDGALGLACTTANTSSTVYYLNCAMASAEIDTVAIAWQNPSGGTYTFQVQFAADSSFTTDLVTVAEWTGVSANTRLVQSGLDYPGTAADGTVRFSTISWARLRVQRTDGGVGTVPVTELLLGRRRVLSHALETGSDLEPRGATWTDTRTAGRHNFRYTHARGFEDHEGRYKLAETSAAGFNDYATLQAIQKECNYGGRPVWARWKTGNNWVLGTFGEPLAFPQDTGAWTQRNWSFTFQELPPFAARGF